MASKSGMEMTDEEVDALVAAVSEELGTVPDDVDDDEDFDFSIEKEPFTNLDEIGTVISRVTSNSEVKSVSNQVHSLTSADSSAINSEPRSQDVVLHSDSEAKAAAGHMKQTVVCDLAENKQSGETVQPVSHSPENSSDNSKDAADPKSSELPLETLHDDKALVVQDNKADSSCSETMTTVAENADNAQASVRVDQAHTDTKASNKPKRDKQVKEKVVKSSGNEASGGGWGWQSFAGWGSSVMNSATALTSHVGESLYHVLEKVESTLVEPESSSSEVDAPKQTRSVDSESNKLPRATKKSSPGSAVKLSASDDQIVSNANEEAENTVQSESDINVEKRADGESSASSKIITVPDTKEKAAVPSRRSQDNVRSPSAERVDEKEPTSNDDDDDEGGGWLSGWSLAPLTQLTGAVKNTGKKVVSTGLGVIGEIGKKTYNALMEEEENQTVKKSPVKQRLSDSSSKQLSFIVSQDDGSGEAHMEALQELSQWSNGLLGKQVGSIAGNQAEALHADLSMIGEAFNLSGLEDLIGAIDDMDHLFAQLTKDFLSQLGLKLDMGKILSIQRATRTHLAELHVETLDPKNVYQKAVKQFAEYTAAAIAMYHKIGQLLLVEASVPLLAYKFRSLSIAGLTKVLCVEMWIQANRYAHLFNDFALNAEAEGDKVASSSLATMIELEASNCSMSMQDACSCLLPIMQLVVARTHPQLADCTGIPHLESLQMFSNMSRVNVKDFVSKLPDELRTKLNVDLVALESIFDLEFFQLDDDCDNNTDDTFGDRINSLIKLLVNQAEPTAAKVVALQQRARKRLREWTKIEGDSDRQITARDIHLTAVQLLSEMTSVSIELYYSLAQLMLLEKPHNVKLYSQKAENLASLTKILCIEIGNLSTQFTNCLSSLSDCPEAVTPFVTNVYLEASSCSTYVQDGFHLLLPVIQLALVKAHPLIPESASAAS